MTGTKHSRYLIPLLLALLLPALPAPVEVVNAAPTKTTNTTPKKFSLNFKPPKRGAPRSTAGGATRGACLAGSRALVPLMPKESIGLTVAERPSFFVYTPPTRNQTAEFLLLTKDDTEVVYQTTFTLPKQAGVIRFDLPKEAPALKVGQEYHWFITLQCDPNRGPSGNPTIEGWVERIEPTPALTQALTTAPPENLPGIYAEAGIWHETLTSLADRRRDTPDNPKLLSDWRDLLRSVGLDGVATEPLVECCLAKGDTQ